MKQAPNKTHCNDCNEKLVVGENWTQKRKDHAMYKCTPCERKEIAGRQMYVDGKYIPKSHPLHKAGKYKSFGDAAFMSLQKDENLKVGYVYAITNKAWDGWVKVGMAVDAEDRLKGYQTSSPFRDYVLHHKVYSDDRRASEQEAHKKAAKVAIESSGEWFKLSVDQAINILENLDSDRLSE